MRHFLSFLVSFFYVLNVVAAPAWFPEGIQTKGSSTIGEKSTANSSAVLDVRSTTKGMLPPRMTTAQRTAIASPATGLLVYDTDTLTVWQYNGTGWVEVGSGGAGGAQYNVIENYDFEATTYSDGWTASAGVLAAATGTNILFGDQSATWDASASSQTLSYTSRAIGQGYKNNNCEGAIFVQTPSGTASHTLQVYDGTNVLASVSITSYTTPKEFSTGAFPCPSSGNWQLRIVANADEPLIAVDNAYLGLFRGVGTADVHTEWRSFTPTGSWVANTTYTGLWRKSGDDYEYQVYLAITGAPTATSLTINHLISGVTQDTSKLLNTSTDGRQTMAECIVRSAGAVYDATAYYNGSNIAVIVKGTASTYATSATNVNATVPATFTNGDSVYCKGKVPILGWAATQTVMPDVQGLSWSGYHSATCIWTTTSTSYADPSDDASCTLSERTNRNFGTVVTYGAAKPGITFTPKKSGTYFVCARSALYNSTVSGYSTMALNTTGGTTATIGTGGIRQGTSSGSNDEKSVTLCGLVNLTSATSTTVRLQIAASTGTTTLADLSSGGTSVEWSIFNVDQPVQAILANSVSSSVANGARMIWASVKSVCSASPCTIGAQSGDFTSITRSGTGAYQANFNAGTFSGTPVCTCSTVGTLDGHCSAYNSTNSISTIRTYTPAGASQDGYIEMMCIGPR